ncbi:alpha/beta hydrolase [uncultured Friedmanniella sp.]|uniref:alpha/beta hydrolase n=1 Tax=uncultured Friedmanniella sp. TaxID=335381 RepID=UPI0035CBA066
MSLTGPALVVLLLAAAVALPLVLVLVWRRRSGVLTGALRWLVILLCQVLAVAGAVAAANDSFGFYNSWDDLLGRTAKGGQAPTANQLVPADGSQGRIVSLPVALGSGQGGHGEHGSHAGERFRVLVWLPPQYDQPQFRSQRLPVTMMLPGQPGTPAGVFREFNFGGAATAAIAAGQVKPFVAVIPPIMIDPPRDTECTDVQGGPQAESWLDRDVRDAVVRHFRVSTSAHQWAVMGWSTGGFCAAKLVLRDADHFGAAVGLGGYYDSETDPTTGKLFGDSLWRREENSPLWLIRHATGTTRLLIVSSQQDRDSWAGVHYADSGAMVAATRGMPGVATIVLPEGGHNYHVYRATLPQVFSWLGANAGL